MRHATTILLAAALAGAAHGQIAAGPFVHPTTGHRYSRTVPLTLANARAAAAAMGGGLAVIHTADLNAWIRSNVASAGGNATPCSIGFNDQATEGSFVWENGDAVFYTNWNAGEPNNQGNEDVAAVLPATGRWNDVITTIPVPAIIEVAGDIRVPAEFPTIQAAINAALDGQTIVVAPGTYTENIDFLYKHLVVRSEAGAEATTIRPVSTLYGVVLNGNQGPETVLEGFTILPDSPSTQQLVVLGQRQVLRACRVSGNGVVSVACYGAATLSDCTLVGSSISVGAAGPGPTTIQNCTIPGAIYLQAGSDGPTTINLVNSIVRGAIIAQATTRLRATHCDILGGWPGVGNFDADPRFVNAPGPDGLYTLQDDYRLAAGSPCIDAGSNTARIPAGPTALPLDLAGSDRLVDDPDAPNAGGAPGAVIDLGAYERPPANPACPIDFNHDGFVDFFDYDDFVSAFENGC